MNFYILEIEMKDIFKGMVSCSIFIVINLVFSIVVFGAD